MANERDFETTYYNAEEVRRAAELKRISKKKNKRRGRVIYFVSVVLVSAILAGVGWLLANDLCALNKPYMEASIVVEEDDSVNDVAKKLKKAGLIEYKGFFKFVGAFMHAKDKIDPGTYEELNTNMDYRSLISNLHDYEADRREAEGLIRLTITEGMTVREVIDLLAENGIATVEELEDACANYEFKDYTFLEESQLGDIERVEGYLFPDTYDFDPNKSAVFAIDTMLTHFVSQLDGDLMISIENTPYTLREIITIASLIEGEAGPNDDKKDFASVIYNRLDAGWKLQLDATLNFIKGTSTFKLTTNDMEIDSPYNTYLYEGLPIGPIGNPGLDAIKATIHPNDTNYWFWYSDGETTHFFETNSEFDAFADAHPYS